MALFRNILDVKFTLLGNNCFDENINEVLIMYFKI